MYDYRCMFIFTCLIQRIFWGSWYSNEREVEELCPLESLFFRCQWRWVCHLWNAGKKSTNPCFNRHWPRLRTKLHLACRSSAFLSRTRSHLFPPTFSWLCSPISEHLQCSSFCQEHSPSGWLTWSLQSFIFHPFRADWVLATPKQCAVTFQQGDSQETSTREQDCCYEWVLRTGEQSRESRAAKGGVRQDTLEIRVQRWGRG